MNVLGAVALTAAVLLGSVWAIAKMLTSALNQVLNPNPEPDTPAETAIQVDLLGEGKGEEDFVPVWEREFEDTEW